MSPKRAFTFSSTVAGWRDVHSIEPHELRLLERNSQSQVKLRCTWRLCRPVITGLFVLGDRMSTTRRKWDAVCCRHTALAYCQIAAYRTEWPFARDEQEGCGVASYPGYMPVNLAFVTLKIRTLCECQAKAEKEYGFAVAKQLRARLADLRELDTVLELPVGRAREISAKPHNIYSVNLAKGYRLLMRANHNKIPVLETGKVDWSEVSRVMIIRIEDGHV